MADNEIPAPGGSTDDRKRAAKQALAAALSIGDTEAADRAQKELDAVNDEIEREQRDNAAAARRNAAQAQQGQDAQTRAPQGRTATPRDTTNAPATGGKTQK